MIADRISVSSSEGLPKVVDAIKLAVETSERKRQLTVKQSATQRAKSLDQTLREKRNAQQLLESVEGAEIISQGVVSLFDAFERDLAELSSQSEILKFECGRPMRNVLYASTAYRVTVGLRIRDLAANSATGAELIANFFLRAREHYEDELVELEKVNFVPSFRSSKSLIWISRIDDHAYEQDALIGFLIDKLTAEVANRADQSC